MYCHKVFFLIVALVVSVSVFAADPIETLYPQTPVFISTQSGNFTAEFDIEIKSGGANASMVGLTPRTTQTSNAYIHAGLLVKSSVQIYDNGANNPRDAEGGPFVVANGGKYHFRFVINRTAMTYTVYATDVTNSGAETEIATSFAIKSGNTEFSCIQVTTYNGNKENQGVILTNVIFTPANPDDPTNSDLTLPTVPAGLEASGITQTSFTLSWTASTDNVGIASYKVLRNGVQQGTTASTSMLISGLTAGTTYSMTVAASDSAGNWSAQSSPLNVTTTSTDPDTPTDPDEGVTTICRWKGNKKAAYTLTIDDAPLNRGDVPRVLSITKPLGIPVTWAVTCRLMWDPRHGVVSGSNAKWTDQWVKDLVEAGHELSSHTVWHPTKSYEVGDTFHDNIRSFTIDSLTIEQVDSLNQFELRESKWEIEEMCPENGKCLTFCCANSWCSYGVNGTVKYVPQYFIAGRGVGHGKKFGPYNPDPNTSDPNKGGLYSLHTVGAKSAFPLDATDYLTGGGWWIESTHGVNETSSSDLTPTEFTARMNELNRLRDVIWAATFRDVAQYITEREAAQTQLVSSTSSEIKLNLTHNLSTTLCDFKYPLTLKTEVYPEWDYVRVKQGDDSVNVSSASEGSKRYVYYDAIPNGAEIVLSSTTPTAIDDVLVNNYSTMLFNTPNPFKDETKVFFSVPVAGMVSLKVYDVTGKEIATIFNERKQQGEFNESWNASGSSPGIYFLKMTVLPDGISSPYIVSKRMLLTK
jgi:hypothetical protein